MATIVAIEDNERLKTGKKQDGCQTGKIRLNSVFLCGNLLVALHVQ